MSRIGIFGGTFAPFHTGHRKALEAFLRLEAPDECLVVPSGTPPHKTKTALFTDEERLEMTKAACKDLPVTVSDWEIRQEGRSYTCNTLKHLKEQFPEDLLILYVGSDMLLTLQDWYHPEEIFRMAQIAAFSRTGEDLEKLQNHAEVLKRTFPQAVIRIHPEPPFPVSSTEIREKWERSEDLSALVPEGVAQFLKEKKYKSLLRTRLSDHRLRHSYGVSKEAELLARIHGADPEKARIAGLLHDMTKEFSREQHFYLFEKYDYPLDENLRTNKNLWHAHSASLDLTETLQITDPEICSAVRYHTTGKADMTLLEAILYVADLTDETRDYDDVDFYRALAREDIYKAAYVAMGWCMEDLKRRGLTVHKDMIQGHAALKKRYPGVTETTEKNRLKKTKGI